MIKTYGSRFVDMPVDHEMLAAMQAMMTDQVSPIGTATHSLQRQMDALSKLFLGTESKVNSIGTQFANTTDQINDQLKALSDQVLRQDQNIAQCMSEMEALKVDINGALSKFKIELKNEIEVLVETRLVERSKRTAAVTAATMASMTPAAAKSTRWPAVQPGMVESSERTAAVMATTMAPAAAKSTRWKISASKQYFCYQCKKQIFPTLKDGVWHNIEPICCEYSVKFYCTSCAPQPATGNGYGQRKALKLP